LPLPLPLLSLSLSLPLLSLLLPPLPLLSLLLLLLFFRRQFLKEIVILSEAKNLLLARAASARSCLYLKAKS
jgi:hypothetical protein